MSPIHSVAVVPVPVGADVCALLATLAPGDIALLPAGDWPLACVMTGGEVVEAGERTTLAPLDPQGPRPRLVPAADDQPVLTFVGPHLQVAGVDVLAPAVGPAMRSAGATDLRLVDVVLAGPGTLIELDGGSEIAIEAPGAVAGPGPLVVADGVSDLSVVGGFIEGVGAVLDATASSVRVRDVFAVGGKGPLVKIADAVGPSFVEGCLLLSDGVALDVSDGAILVRNDILGGAEAALQVSGADVRVLGVSVVATSEPGMALDGVGEVASVLVSTHATWPEMTEGQVRSCGSPEACWLDVMALDFRPVESWSGDGTSDDALDADFCGDPRGSAPTAGAVEPTGEGHPLVLEAKSSQPCGLPDLDRTAPEDFDTGVVVVDEPPVGCGACEGDGRAASSGAALTTLLLWSVAVGARTRVVGGR